MTLRALFRESPASSRAGRVFTVVHEPPGPTRAVVVAVHAFAEEMNKSRPMVAMTARALAAEGCVVVRPDLRGCGDSEGDLATLSWDDWRDDVLDAARWAQQLAPGRPLWFWGHRAGCLLACEASACHGGESRLLLWQPQLLGKQVLVQFLRLKMAGQLQQGAAKGATEGLQRELSEGRAVEIAGYRLGPGIAAGMAAAQCSAPPSRAASEVVWLEVAQQSPASLLPASEAAIARWTAAGSTIDARVVEGPLFWQSLGIELAPALVQATVAAIEARHEDVVA